MVPAKLESAVRQTQIADAARKLIIKYGSEHITVRKIAKEVGISEAAIYRHFKSKKELLLFMVDNIERDLLGDFAAESAGSTSPLLILDTILRSHISAIKQRRGVSFQVITEIISFGDKKLNRRASTTVDEYMGRLKGLLSAAVKAGEVRDDIDPGATTALLFGMIQGLVNRWALSNYNFDLEDRYIPLWQTFCQVIAKR